ncbi:hypothetical protein TNCV_4677101 [Trichonephila clavipes]|nr:hypothetical protein TNCV_4677101 [Trichonephila clavipes]
MHTRCLKCGESHRTNDCPIKEKIQNPVCINCNKTGHMANWSQCEEFPKKKPEKRVKIEKEKLNSWMLLCTQNDITRETDYNEAISDYAMIKARRERLLYKPNDSDSTKHKDV